MPNNTTLNKQVGGGHYKKYAIQPVEYAMANNLNYCQANAIKYVTRYRDKGGLEDLKKAIHNIEILMELEGYETEPNGSSPQLKEVSATDQGDFFFEKPREIIY